MLRSDVPTGKTVLSPKVAFKVKLTDEANKYELQARTCANGSRQIEGTDFDKIGRAHV